jgi:hypothetical protein
VVPAIEFRRMPELDLSLAPKRKRLVLSSVDGKIASRKWQTASDDIVA